MQVPARLPPSCVTLGNLLNLHVYSFSKIGMIIAHISWSCCVDYLGYGLLDDQQILAFMLIYIHIYVCVYISPYMFPSAQRLITFHFSNKQKAGYPYIQGQFTSSFSVCPHLRPFGRKRLFSCCPQSKALRTEFQGIGFWGLVT